MHGTIMKGRENMVIIISYQNIGENRYVALYASSQVWNSIASSGTLVG